MKNDLTAIIVSFFRYEYLEKCLESLRKTYPDINIIVGNNGNPDNNKKMLCKLHKAKYYKLPFDCGVCVGRNELVKKVKTKYVLIGDDDFFYNENAKVDLLLDCCKKTDYDLIGGRINEYGEVKNYQGFIHKTENSLIYEKLNISSEDIQACDLTFNYFVAETKAVKKTKWDENIKVAYEHSTFFIDFREKGFKVGFKKDAIVIHKPQIIIQDKEEYRKYQTYRSRKTDKDYFFKKYNIDFTIDMNGKKTIFDGTGMDEIDFLITHFERKECLENLLFSIAKFNPNANIFIADQSKKFKAEYYFDLYERLKKQGLNFKPKAFNIGYDKGLSYARNFLLKMTSRNFKLILEDDFVFTKDTNIKEMLKNVKTDDYSIIGGSVWENGQELKFVHNFRIENETLYHEKAENNKCVQCIPNFFIAKKEVFEKVLWDENIKINGEHTDFFLSIMKDTNFKIGYSPEFKISHEKIRYDGYKELRQRRGGLKYLLEKHGLKRMVYVDNFCYELEKGEIKSYSSLKSAKNRKD